jgi:hypothetical protein
VERVRFVPSQLGGIPPRESLAQFGQSDAVTDVQNMHLSYCTTSRVFAALSEKW